MNGRRHLWARRGGRFGALSVSLAAHGAIFVALILAWTTPPIADEPAPIAISLVAPPPPPIPPAPPPTAKAVKPEVEKLITLAKRGDLHARRQALSALGQDKFAVYKLFEEIAPRYSERNGGYTRILKLGPRRSDSTEMVFLELV